MKNNARLRRILCALIVATCAARNASAFMHQGTVALPNGLSARDLTLFPEHSMTWSCAPVVRVQIENPTPKEQSVTIGFGNDDYVGTFANVPYCQKASTVATIQPGASAVVEMPVVNVGYGYSGSVVADVPSGKKSVPLVADASGKPEISNDSSNVYMSSTAAKENFSGCWSALKNMPPPPIPRYADIWFTSASSFAEPWPENTGAYMPFDAVVIEAKELPSVSSGARAALRDYVAQGGLVFFIGATEFPTGFTERELFAKTPAPAIPDVIRGNMSVEPKPGVEKIIRSGYGTVALIDKPPKHETGSSKGDFKSETDKEKAVTMFSMIFNAHRTLSVDADYRMLRDVYRAPDDSNYSIETGPFILLLTVFAVLFGPVALRILARRGARIHILWVLPAGSLLFCIAILFWITATEGFKPRIDRHAATFIDQRIGRALTTGTVTVRATHRLGADLVFSKNSQVMPRGDFGIGSRSVKTDSAQRLVGHWAPPRTPVDFAVRRIESDPRRVDVKFDSEGRPAAVNALGAALKTLCICNGSGEAFIAENVAAGATLTPDDFMRTDPSSMIDSPDPNKTTDPNDTSKALPALRNFYRAVFADDCPFVEDPLEGRPARRSADGTVYGMF